MATQRRQLSRERILDAAGRVVEKDGLDALSMRRLAEELDVWPMSIYRHFRDKEELLGALVESAAGDVELPAAEGSWRARMRDLLAEARAALGGHPGGLVARAMSSPALLRVSDAGLEILRDAGLGPAEAAGAWRTLWSYTVGFHVPAGDPALQLRSAIAGMADGRHPGLAWAGNELVSAFTEPGEFERGLERLLDGLPAVDTAK